MFRWGYPLKCLSGFPRKHIYDSQPTVYISLSVSLPLFLHSFIHSFIHSDHFYSASSSSLLFRGAPDTARILCRSFTPKRHRQLVVKDLPKVPTWRLERDPNPRPSGRQVSTLLMRHHAPCMLVDVCIAACVLLCVLEFLTLFLQPLSSLHFVASFEAVMHFTILAIFLSLVDPPRMTYSAFSRFPHLFLFFCQFLSVSLTFSLSFPPSRPPSLS